MRGLLASSLLLKTSHLYLFWEAGSEAIDLATATIHVKLERDLSPKLNEIRVT